MPSATCLQRSSALLTALVLDTACAGQGARSPHAASLVDEPRALRLIASAVTAAGEQPTSGVTIRLPSGRELRVDVGVRGHRYGVAYLTETDLAELRPSEDLPPPLPDGDLPLVQGGGADHEVVALVLLARPEIEGALQADRHEQAVIAVENRIQRDVRDFVSQARKRRLP
jgi:hypothetical protein